MTTSLRRWCKAHIKHLCHVFEAGPNFNFQPQPVIGSSYELVLRKLKLINFYGVRTPESVPGPRIKPWTPGHPALAKYMIVYVVGDLVPPSDQSHHASIALINERVAGDGLYIPGGIQCSRGVLLAALFPDLPPRGKKAVIVSAHIVQGKESRDRVCPHSPGERKP
uniref:Uncharacterized protein n=1 Tax=Timema cristinae TaxID=61476 RepID=A0A7R9CPP9_TIMCR|nr:unnamed protein product [Timema cristinae]